MINQTFSHRSFLRLLKRGDPHRFNIGKTKTEYVDHLKKCANAVSKASFTFSPFNFSKRGQGDVFTPSCLNDEFALRKINDNIKRTYNIRSADRNKIISQVITLLREETSLFVVRLDIKKFYENVDRTALLDILSQDSRLSYQTRKLLLSAFASPQFARMKGLPLGLSISSTLSELYMMDFDAFCKGIGSAYYYVRYVDDILLFFHEEPRDIDALIESKLPGKLKLNRDKYDIFHIDNKGYCTSPNKVLTYLGYDFVFRSLNEKSVPRVSVRIAQKKIKKIKTRIALSLFDYLRNGDYQLLKDRFTFLSSNYTLENEKATGKLYSGIYYNYRFIDNSAINALTELDIFLRKAVFSRKSSLGKRLSCQLTRARRNELCSQSFLSGYTQRIVRNFSHSDLNNIKRIWAHA